jgi:hypothetical protein
MAYWGKVAARAFKEAAELVGFGSAERAVVTVALQAAIAVLIYLLLGDTELHDNTGVRLATALAPLAVFPLLFVWKMLTVPPALHEQQRREEDWERDSHVWYLCQKYVKEERPENAYYIEHRFAFPPADWINARLEELEFKWRVKIHPGAKFTTYELD